MFTLFAKKPLSLDQAAVAVYKKHGFKLSIDLDTGTVWCIDESGFRLGVQLRKSLDRQTIYVVRDATQTNDYRFNTAHEAAGMAVHILNLYLLPMRPIGGSPQIMKPG